MAKSALRIRFVFNQQEQDQFEPARRQRFGRDFAQSIVQDFAFQYAEDSYRDMAGRIERQLRYDVMRELRFMTSLFRRHIIGVGPTRNRPPGTLETVASPWEGFAERMPISAAIPAWAARSQQYLAAKRRQVRHQRWWDHRGTLSRAMTADSWMAAFGPINVVFRRTHTPTAATGVQFNQHLGKVRVAIGTIHVFALTQITPSMLPALRTGDPSTMNSDEGNPELMGRIRIGMGDDVAYRLGRRSTRESGMRYRPTLEPFLAYFLTRSVPNAVARRVGEIGRTGRGGGSAGRTR